MPEDEKQWVTQELARMDFEFFKHLTTLSAAAVVAVLAVYREVTFDRFILIVTLLCFAVATALSLAGMQDVTRQMQKWSRDRRPTYVKWDSLLNAAALTFLLGITTLVSQSFFGWAFEKLVDPLVDPLPLPSRIGLAVVAVLLIGLAWFAIYRWMQRVEQRLNKWFEEWRVGEMKKAKEEAKESLAVLEQELTALELEIASIKLGIEPAVREDNGRNLKPEQEIKDSKGKGRPSWKWLLFGR